jgi:transcriptional regulator with XRE-family HTH domain
MDRHKDLRRFIRDACRRRSLSLGQASKAMGKSRNWLERIVNYDPKTRKGIKRPRMESCYELAEYFNEDPNYILQLAGYISPPPPENPMVDEITSIAHLLPEKGRLDLLDYARLLKLRSDTTPDDEG